MAPEDFLFTESRYLFSPSPEAQSYWEPSRWKQPPLHRAAAQIFQRPLCQPEVCHYTALTASPLSRSGAAAPRATLTLTPSSVFRVPSELGPVHQWSSF